ncbi:hypothetical protein ACPXB3_01155 [Gordonia sp. DT219]|uniref:hypothetical protein n=1 Tax=Gordonia sp. DT219 TaxID=3416658 RepID=UPI003CFB744B
MTHPYPSVPPATAVPARGSRMPGGRGPWWAQVVVSAVIAIVLWWLALAILMITYHAFPTDDMGANVWATYVAWTIIYLIVVATVGVWGRTPVRGLLGAGFAFVVLALSRGVEVLLDVDGSSFYLLAHDWYDAVENTSTVLLLTGTIGGWSIARRTTPFAWIGALPAIGVVAIATWVDEQLRDSLSWWPWSWPSSAYVSIQTAFIILGILVVWGCDAIGLAVRRGRPTPPSSGPAPWNTQPGQTTWPPPSPVAPAASPWPGGPPQPWPGQPPYQPPPTT